MSQSNAIGNFQIGVSSIGIIPPFDFNTTVMSQYANSTVLMQLLQDFNDCIDQTANIESFFDQVWNVLTATGYGLDVWGRIVGVSRVLQVNNDKFLAFEETGDSSTIAGGFNQAPFYTGGGTTSNYRLADEAYRTLILAKALANICDGSILAINNLLMNLFPDNGDSYVTDGQNMTMTYTFTMPLTPVQTAIVYQSGVLPKPVGVLPTIVSP